MIINAREFFVVKKSDYVDINECFVAKESDCFNINRFFNLNSKQDFLFCIIKMFNCVILN